jgi:hypothetical protein
MSKNIIIILLGVIILLIVGGGVAAWKTGLLSDDSAEIKVHQDSVIIAKGDIVGIQARERALIDLIKRSDEIEAAARKKFERRIAVLNAKIQATTKETKWATVVELDSLREGIYGKPGNDTLYAMPLDHARDLLITKAIQPMNDSLYSEQVIRNEALEAEKNRVERDCDAQLALKDTIHVKDQVIIRNLEAENEKRKNRAKKEKFWDGVKRWGERVAIFFGGYGASEIRKR